MYPRSVRALQADALFASALQRRDEVNVSQIHQAIAVSLDAYGGDTGRFPDAAERHLVRAEREMTAVPVDQRGRFQVNLAMMRLLLAQRRSDLPAVIEEAQRLLAPGESADAARPGRCQDLRALALVSLGTAELWALRANEAEPHLEQGVAMARQIGRPWLGVSALAHGAWAASFRSFRLAAERYLQAIELAQEHGWAEEPVVAPAYAGLGAIRVWQMRLEDAEALLEHAERALRGEVEPAAGVVLHQARGMLELAHGRDGKAMVWRDGQSPHDQGGSWGVAPPANRPAQRERGPGPALPADPPARAGDRRPAVSVGEHGPDAHAARLRKARRAQPCRGRRPGPHPRPARTVIAQAVTGKAGTASPSRERGG